MQIYDIDINENKMETTSHKTDDFPVAIYETILKKNILGFVDWHWHSEIQFCYVTAGRVRFCVNSFSAVVEKDGGIFINSGALHMAEPMTDDAAYICIDASSEIIGCGAIGKKYVLPYINDPSFSFEIFDEDGRAVIDRLKRAHDVSAERSFGYEIEVASLLSMCWKDMLQNRTPAEVCENETYERLKSILTYIHDHYSEKISLSGLAEEIHLCPSECCRYFKKRMNRTIFEYITDYRITQSTNALINEPEMSISRIAYEYGFGSTSYYIEKFKSKTGTTPLAYRKSFPKAGL
ncbi:MAG TPA: AraC family transcriptional regulator [Firmicutes bacterium]|nr:AraC family transcriptional regulator [Bacillota bacterium]